MTFLYSLFSLLTFLLLTSVYTAQECGDFQNLTSEQNLQLNAIFDPLEAALADENLFQIELLTEEMKNIFADQSGIPEVIEIYFPLVENSDWIDQSEALLLSRELIVADSLIYVDLWKIAKGMLPPTYEPNSIFLRASAEIAVGLLKIADKETDLDRKTLYESWAIRALDSLATMQLPNGSFPFPDLREYGDPVFSSIIQNFMNTAGVDSVNILQDGWIIDDYGTGEFKFDAGVIANAFYQAYLYTNNPEYSDIVISIGDYLEPLSYNLNYNYNTFSSIGLTRAYQLTNSNSYLERAIENLRYSVFPGQMENGRWVDGHNASSRYHNIIIQNSAPTIPIIPTGHQYEEELRSMILLATNNLVYYSNSCNSATGYLWLMEAYQLDETIIPVDLKNEIHNLIGRHINQSVINGKYLNVLTMGNYLELFDSEVGTQESFLSNSTINIYPNPATHYISITTKNTDPTEWNLFNNLGNIVKTGSSNINNFEIDIKNLPFGTYFLQLISVKEQLNFNLIKAN